MTEEVQAKDLKKKKEKIIKTPEIAFQEQIRSVTEESLQKPWMKSKVFRLITTTEDLEKWVNQVLEDTSRHHELNGEKVPVIAVDTETVGLDTRIIDGKFCGTLAGVCLSSDGNEGIYIPINHIDGNNVPTADCARLLQHLFDRSHLVFYNAKYDREVLRGTLGIQFRDYPDYEDVQVLNYLDDPKASVEEDGSRGALQIGGLKPLALSRLGIEMIELETLTKVKAQVWNDLLQKYTQRTLHVPFTWVPTSLALWYAAGDAICTWLLWAGLQETRSMAAVHRVDHLLIDTLTWIERQRIRVDVARLKDTIAFHNGKLSALAAELTALSGLPEGEELNPNSGPQLKKILFDNKKLQVLKRSEKTKEPSASYEVLVELQKMYPEDEFLSKLLLYREYSSLHPDTLRYDPRDNSARFYFKQNVVAGGRLAAAGGEFEKDGGCELNPQAIKRVEGNWWVKGKLLEDQSDTHYDSLEDLVDPEGKVIIDPSCLKDGQWAPGITKHHIGTYFGKRYCMVPGCKIHSGKAVKVDANEILNLRGLFTADPGWTMFSIDYSNIEMRVAANISKEPMFIREFLEGSGDFHSLTARALFPEFTDPDLPKARRKQLRSLAKIINFALLYGGSAYTIHTNMNAAGFDVSFEEAETMVNKYWESVPLFFEWCQNKRTIARRLLQCKTPTGRLIGFSSAMKAFHIRTPKDGDKERYWDYKKLVRVAESFTKRNQKEDAAAAQASADALFKDPASGVKNYQEYTRFLGKAERVAINIPLQGTAGDLMRSALNKIRIWAQHTHRVEDVMRIHGSVHDEIDFSVKNEYAPYIIPRVNRYMKLRKLHENRKWEVPIETDCEYGQSWDVQYHLTGDDGHAPSAWVDVPGMENYIPPEYDESDLNTMISACQKGKIEKVGAWIKDNLHPRVHGYVEELSKTSDYRRILLVILQLDEFWRIDEDENGDLEESIEQYAKRRALPLCEEPKIGGLPSYLASVPLGSGAPTPIVVEKEEIEEKSEPEYDDEEEVFYKPKKKTSESPDPISSPAESSPIPVVRLLSEEELKEFVKDLGVGKNTAVFRYNGSLIRVEKIHRLPEKYIV